MIDDNIKKQADEITNILPSDSPIEPIEDFVTQSQISKMPEDAKVLRDAAWEQELLRREGNLEENEKKYEAAMVEMVLNKDGTLEERVIVSKSYWKDGELHINLNAFGYDRLPSDVQEAIGTKDEVVGEWITMNKQTWDLYEGYITYAHHDNEGHDTWESYRDAKGFGEQKETTIEYAKDVDENTPPRDTPSVDGDTINLKR